MVSSIWNEMPQVEIRVPKPREVAPVVSSEKARQVLSEIGENAIALNTPAMERQKMKPLFKGFNPEEITPKELSKAGMVLYKFGLIDNLTADLMSRAGAEFDKNGKVINADQPINALEFLAQRIVEMKEKTLWGDRYAEALLPDYIRTIHIVQNLQVFAESGDSPEMVKIKAEERDGKRPVTRNAKAP